MIGHYALVVDRVPELPKHESGVRRMVSDAGGVEYHAFESLTAASQDPDAVGVLEGDDGGQIYAVFPIRLIACEEAVLGLGRRARRNASVSARQAR